MDFILSNFRKLTGGIMIQINKGGPAAKKIFFKNPPYLFNRNNNSVAEYQPTRQVANSTIIRY
jgi:hypothetical protein